MTVNNDSKNYSKREGSLFLFFGRKEHNFPLKFTCVVYTGRFIKNNLILKFNNVHPLALTSISESYCNDEIFIMLFWLSNMMFFQSLKAMSISVALKMLLSKEISIVINFLISRSRKKQNINKKTKSKTHNCVYCMHIWFPPFGVCLWKT